MRRWLMYGGFVLWLVLGIVSVTISSEPQPLGPEAAQMVFGNARSIASSAPDGLLAFARVLERMGFAVSEHRRAAPPRDDRAVLVLLGAKALPSEHEIALLFRWLNSGGRLIYGSPEVSIAQKGIEGSDEVDDEAQDTTGEADEEYVEDEAEEEIDEDMPFYDPLIEQLEETGIELEGLGGASTLWRVGLGRVAVLADAGAALSNAHLKDNGLTDELAWLVFLLEGRRNVLFDEARLGFAAPEGLSDVVFKSRFGAALRLGLLALLLYVLAYGVRQMPPQPEPPPGVRAFSEHLDAVAGALDSGHRIRLAGQALLDGTRRRLGALASTPQAAQTLATVQAALLEGMSPTQMARSAERLRRLETQLGTGAKGDEPV